MARRKIITVQFKQTIFDIALQYYGDDDAVSMLFEDNPNLPGYDTVLSAGQKLEVKQAPVNQLIVDYYLRNQIVPVTEVENIDDFLGLFRTIDDGTERTTDLDHKRTYIL